MPRIFLILASGAVVPARAAPSSLSVSDPEFANGGWLVCQAVPIKAIQATEKAGTQKD